MLHIPEQGLHQIVLVQQELMVVHHRVVVVHQSLIMVLERLVIAPVLNVLRVRAEVLLKLFSWFHYSFLIALSILK